MKGKKIWNPVRGTLWLPPDVANLDEIDFEPLPESAQQRAQAPAVVPDVAVQAA